MLFGSSSTTKMRRFPFAVESETGSSGMGMAFQDCYMLNQVMNQAPSKPIRTPMNGLEMANQNGIASFRGIASHLMLAV